MEAFFDTSSAWPLVMFGFGAALVVVAQVVTIVLCVRHSDCCHPRGQPGLKSDSSKMKKEKKKKQKADDDDSAHSSKSCKSDQSFRTKEIIQLQVRRKATSPYSVRSATGAEFSGSGGSSSGASGFEMHQRPPPPAAAPPPQHPPPPPSTSARSRKSVHG